MNETVYYLVDEDNKVLKRIPIWAQHQCYEILEFEGCTYIVTKISNVCGLSKREAQVYLVDLDKEPKHTLTVYC